MRVRTGAAQVLPQLRHKTVQEIPITMSAPLPPVAPTQHVNSLVPVTRPEPNHVPVPTLRVLAADALLPPEQRHKPVPETQMEWTVGPLAVHLELAAAFPGLAVKREPILEPVQREPALLELALLLVVQTRRAALWTPWGGSATALSVVDQAAFRLMYKSFAAPRMRRVVIHAVPVCQSNPNATVNFRRKRSKAMRGFVQTM